MVVVCYCWDVIWVTGCPVLACSSFEYRSYLIALCHASKQPPPWHLSPKWQTCHFILIEHERPNGKLEWRNTQSYSWYTALIPWWYLSRGLLSYTALINTPLPNNYLDSCYQNVPRPAVNPTSAMWCLWTWPMCLKWTSSVTVLKLLPH